MTDRERAFAALGIEYAEGIDQARTVAVPATGREVRRTAKGGWEAQPHNDNYWQEFDDLLEAVRFATPPQISVTRTGLAHLTFHGEKLASVVGARQGGQERDRWHEIAVWRTTSGQLVVGITYRTRWQGELSHDAAVVCATALDVVRSLHDYDPVAHVVGYPPDAVHAGRQARLLADLRLRYQVLVSQVLAVLPEAAERVS